MPPGRRPAPCTACPFTVKDAIATAGIRSTSGAPELRDFVPVTDATAVARLRGAGGVPVGKTNTSTWCADLESFNPLGVFGRKPTFGIVPADGYLDTSTGPADHPLDMNVFGPIAHSAADLGVLLDALAGPGPDDIPGWRLELPDRRQDAAGLRVAVWSSDPFAPPEPGTHADLRDLLMARRERARQRAVWTRWSRDVDILLCPVMSTLAFNHHQNGSFRGRRITCSDGTVRRVRR